MNTSSGGGSSGSGGGASGNAIGRKDDIQFNVLVNEMRAASGVVDSEDAITQRSSFIREKLSSLSEEQWERFEFFVRSHFSRRRVKTIMQNALGGMSIPDDVTIVVSGLTKLFVGELCDIAADVMREEEGESEGHFTPTHIQEAYRRLQKEGKIGRPLETSFALGSEGLGPLQDELVPDLSTKRWKFESTSSI